MGEQITSDECRAIYREMTGREIAASTWSSYVARGQAPKAVDHKMRTPVWDRAEVVAWINARPRVGPRSETGEHETPG